MNLEKLRKEFNEYSITRTYPKFENDFIANFVLKEIEGAYFNGGKNIIEKYKNILFDIKNEINNYRLRKGDEDDTIWTEKGLINYIETELQKNLIFDIKEIYLCTMSQIYRIDVLNVFKWFLTVQVVQAENIKLAVVSHVIVMLLYLSRKTMNQNICLELNGING